MNQMPMHKLKREIMSAMRLATPKDTGNLAYSSMKGYITKKGIKIIYDGKRAPYGKILNQIVQYRIKTGNYVRFKRNRHFGWNNRAQINGTKVMMSYLGQKKTTMYNTKQNYRFPLDSEQGKRARQAQYEKTLNNRVIQEYERANKVFS